jgi:hypothetical protein
VERCGILSTVRNSKPTRNEDRIMAATLDDLKNADEAFDVEGGFLDLKEAVDLDEARQSIERMLDGARALLDLLEEAEDAAEEAEEDE